LRKRGAKRTFGGTVSASAVARAHQLGVDERAAGVHVREQPPVAVALLDVELEPHVAVVDQARVERAGAVAVALGRRVGLLRLGRVDADVTHPLGAPGAEPHADGVAVGDRHDAAAERPAVRRAQRRAAVVAAGEGGGREHGRHRRAAGQTRAPDSASS